MAWGEYPLSFAAVLSQEECYRLILSRGGNPDLQDTNGNSVTHIMVVFDNMKMFDLAVETGASINLTNNQNMTPLTVAAYLARMDMFFHIANIEREVYWQIGTRPTINDSKVLHCTLAVAKKKPQKNALLHVTQKLS